MRQRSRPGVVAALLLTLLSAAGTLGAAEPAKQAATTAPPSAPPAVRRPPNILFVIADDWGWGHAGAYGCRWIDTPAFDRVARDGLLFTRAYTPNAKCAPSRSCILTGRNPWQLGAAANHWCFFPPDTAVFPDELRKAGWFVAGTGKGWSPGVALTADGAKRDLIGRWFAARKAAPPTKAISNNDYAGNFADFLDAAPAGKPWFFWCGGLEPHRGYEYGTGVRTGGRKPADIDRVPGFWPDTETVRNDLLDYGFEVQHFDRHLGRMLDELGKRGLLDDTLVVVTSDNGPPFPRLKGNVYDGANRLPLAVMWKAGIRAPGRKIDDHVSFVDLAPTFLAAAGIAWEGSGLAPGPGRALTDIFASDKAGVVTTERDHVLLGRERTDIGRPGDAGYPVRAIVSGDVFYGENHEPLRWPAGNPETGYLDCDGGPTKTAILEARRRDGASAHWTAAFGLRPREELYDLAADPDCLKNLAGDPAWAERKGKLRERMTAGLRAQGDPRMDGRGAEFDKHPYADPGGRNFHERWMRGEKLKAGWVEPGDFEKLPLPEATPAPVPGPAPVPAPNPAPGVPKVPLGK